MKIEIAESLGYSYLRHVRQCWLVQTNWKASEHWDKLLPDDELEDIFHSMRQTFDLGGSVFKGTKDCSQFLKQGEIDVVGVGQDGSVHAMEVAFHEAGLNYGGGVGNRILKKLLRIMLILTAYHRAETKRHIYLVSPKVHRGVQQPLEEIFGRLRAEYPATNWHLLTNGEFTNQVLVPTLEKARSVADTTELFMRSVKLMEIGGLFPNGNGNVPPQRTENGGRAADYQISTTESEPAESGPAPTVIEQPPESRTGLLQPLVQALMKTLLEDFPGLLSEYYLRNLMDENYCRDQLDLQLGGFSLLRKREDGRGTSGHARYWAKVYGGQYYVTNNWWAQHHVHNGRSLLRFVEQLLDQRPGHPGAGALERRRAALRNYVG